MDPGALDSDLHMEITRSNVGLGHAHTLIGYPASMLELVIFTGSLVAALWRDAQELKGSERKGASRPVVRIWKLVPEQIFPPHPGESAEMPGRRAQISALMRSLSRDATWRSRSRTYAARAPYWDLSPRDVPYLYAKIVKRGLVPARRKPPHTAEMIESLRSLESFDGHGFRVELLGPREVWTPQEHIFGPGDLWHVQVGPPAPGPLSPSKVREPLKGEERATRRLCVSTSLPTAIVSMGLYARQAKAEAGGLTIYRNTDQVVGWTPSPLLVPDALDLGEVWVLTKTPFTPVAELEGWAAGEFVSALHGVHWEIIDEELPEMQAEQEEIKETAQLIEEYRVLE